MRKSKKTGTKKTCGIMMPLAPQKFASFEYSEEYWESMLMFLRDAIREAGYEPVPVWEDAANATVTKRIVENIRSVNLSVCVVSSFNPNVMIELGMRLFAGLPVLVLLDGNTSVAPFDIKDLEYYKIPTRPLYAQYPEIKKKIAEFLEKMSRDDYKNFKDNFSSDSSAPDREKYMGEKLTEISADVKSLRNDLSGLTTSRNPDGYVGPTYHGPTGPTPFCGSVPVAMPDVSWLDGVLPNTKDAGK